MAGEQHPPQAGTNHQHRPGPWGEFPSPSAQELSRLHRKMKDGREEEGRGFQWQGLRFLQPLIIIMNSKSGRSPSSGCQGDKHLKQLVPSF